MRKIGLQEIQLLSSRTPQKWLKKPFQAFKSINSDVQARSQAEITISGQLEHGTDAKNRTSRNSASEVTNPLEMVKKHFRLLNRSMLMSELRVRPKLRFWAKKSIKQTRKIGVQGIQLLNSRIPQKFKKKHFGLLNRSILMFELGVRPKLRFRAKKSMQQTRKIGLQEN